MSIAPRPSDGSRQNHGGVAAIISDRVTCRLIATPREFATFESVCFSDRRLSTIYCFTDPAL